MTLSLCEFLRVLFCCLENLGWSENILKFEILFMNRPKRDWCLGFWVCGEFSFSLSSSSLSEMISSLRVFVNFWFDLSDFFRIDIIYFYSREFFCIGRRVMKTKKQFRFFKLEKLCFTNQIFKQLFN